MRVVGGRRVWSVTDVTAALAGRLKDIPQLWIEAEIHSIRRRGGQVYFTLVDEHQMDASMNAIVFDRLRTKPRDGSLVHVRGQVDFWAERAQIRVRVESVELAGEGLLLAQIEELRARLDAEGLTAAARKRPLPMLPRRIGLVTSARGAARDDFLNNLWARFPDADVLLMDVPVQGDAAPAAIVRALRRLDAAPEVDVIVVARGGGALEDLMAFNSEVVCRAVAGCGTPVVSAVGHEKDVTLCDLVADRRVSTPTAAAEAVVPDGRALLAHLEKTEMGMIRGLVRVRAAAEDRCERRAGGLAAALRGVEARSAQRVASGEQRMRAALRRAPGPYERLLADTPERIRRAVDGRVARYAGHVDRAAAVLEVLSPRRTLRRGYAIVRAGDGTPVTDARVLTAGTDIRVEFHEALIAARVTGVA